MLKFFYSPGSCALATHIALVDAGASYEPVRLNLANQDQRQPEYLAINPKGRVPALVTDQGVLTETPALLAYLAQRFPAARLAPLDDAFAFARVQAFNAYLCATVHVAFAHRTRPYRWADEPEALDAMKRKTPQNVTQCFELIERDLTGQWVMGERYTICDPYLFTLAGWLEAAGVDTSRFPRVMAHRERCAALPNVKRALAEQRA